MNFQINKMNIYSLLNSLCILFKTAAKMMETRTWEKETQSNGLNRLFLLFVYLLFGFKHHLQYLNNLPLISASSPLTTYSSRVFSRSFPTNLKKKDIK